MKVDYVFILAAGKGTRMGKIGKSVPKVIWPVFEKSLLELEIIYARRLAPGAKIFINLFNYSDTVENFLKLHLENFDDIEILHEKKILDIGGAIHNLGHKLNYQGNILILNSDQFLYCEKDIIDKGLVELEETDSLLFSYAVNPDDGYNALGVENGFLKDIIPNADVKKNTSTVTYTGMSLIRLDRLDPLFGESKFFDSVANYKQKKIRVLEVTEFEYWDFGTLKRYHTSIFALLENLDSKFARFLIEQDCIDLQKVDKLTYGDEKYIIFNDFKISKESISFMGGQRIEIL